MITPETLHLLIGLGLGLTLGGVTATIICSLIYSRSLDQIRAVLQNPPQ